MDVIERITAVVAANVSTESYERKLFLEFENKKAVKNQKLECLCVVQKRYLSDSSHNLFDDHVHDRGV